MGVYRKRNAARIAALLDGPSARSQRVSLWALDEPDAALAPVTAGTGAGGKFDLLNEVLRLSPPQGEEFVIVVDDDVDLVAGDLAGLCGMMLRAGLGLAQPAHARGSRSSYEFNRHRALARARVTTFVEIGPIFAIAPHWRSRLLPFPAGMGMGWGLELIWARLQREGCRLGVVDAVRVMHPDPPTAGYALEEEEARAQALMAQAGVSTMREAQQVTSTWWCWQRRPPWS